MTWLTMRSPYCTFSSFTILSSFIFYSSFPMQFLSPLDVFLLGICVFISISWHTASIYSVFFLQNVSDFFFWYLYNLLLLHGVLLHIIWIRRFIRKCIAHTTFANSRLGLTESVHDRYWKTKSLTPPSFGWSNTQYSDKISLVTVPWYSITVLYISREGYGNQTMYNFVK